MGRASHRRSQQEENTALKVELKRLRSAIAQMQQQLALEYKRGFETGGLAMKRAIQHAQEEPTKNPLTLPTECAIKGHAE